MENIINEKNKLRIKIKKMRDAISEDDKKIFDELIFNKLINDENFKKANNYFIFVNFGSEIDTKKIIIYLLKNNKNVFVPKVVGKNMELRKINTLDDLEKGYMGILEPKNNCVEFKNEKLDFILMPGLAFDRSGCRIGYGGGYYDKFLGALDYLEEIPKIAIGYKFQLIDYVPVNDYDIKVDRLITN
jgi:5-formyltetrahydrofolate cyclo-ligase